MATTTNYGWTTPDDTALVKDGASAIRSLGTSVDTTTKNLNPSTTLGDIEYRSSTANTNTRLGIGSTGQILTVAGGVPSWAAPAGGGKVLQVVSAFYDTTTTTNTSTYVDSGLSLSITPSSASSKVLVLVEQNGIYKEGSTGVNLRLLRGATVLKIFAGYAAYRQSDSGNIGVGGAGIGFLDSPATTSATTYKTQFGSSENSSLAGVNGYSSNSTIILLEIGA
jgi:hypothetical protein